MPHESIDIWRAVGVIGRNLAVSLTASRSRSSSSSGAIYQGSKAPPVLIDWFTLGALVSRPIILSIISSAVSFIRQSQKCKIYFLPWPEENGSTNCLYVLCMYWPPQLGLMLHVRVYWLRFVWIWNGKLVSGARSFLVFLTLSPPPFPFE
jgi:hypothetical protein